jgi:hypothetical protein
MTLFRFENAASIERNCHDQLIAEDPLIPKVSFSFPFVFQNVQKFCSRILDLAQNVHPPIL